MKSLYFILFLTVVIPSRAQIITTIAGNGIGSYTGDGVQATATSLKSPYGVGMDSLGNLFIGDYNNNRIRKINTSGIISTVAGTGVAGFNGDGLMATATQLNGPYGMSVNRAGTIVIADRSNHRLRTIQTEVGGVVITLAGTGVAGFSGDGGLAVSAQLNHPQGPFWDQVGNVYFCDADNHRVRRVDGTSGIITTIAGTGIAGYSGDGGPATAARLDEPSGVTKDSAGNIYIAEWNNHCIRRVDPSGIITTICGTGSSGYSGDGGPAASATLRYPKDVYVDQHGNIIISDTDNQRVRKINQAGIITTIAGNGSIGFSGDGGPATAASMNYLQGVFVDSADDIYIGDCSNHRVRKINCTAPIVAAIAGADTVCIGTPITLTSATPGGRWISTNPRATISGTGIVSGVTPGIDTIKYVVDNSCTSVAVSHIVYISTCAATTEIKPLEPYDTKIYPNPATNELVISSTSTIKDVALINLVGQVIHTSQHDNTLIQIDISTITRGIYFVKINGVSTGRFVKE